MSEPELTIVVPTRDRPQSLELCLVALERQTGIPAYEIVVVDDGSVEAERIAGIAGSHLARLVRTDGLGPAAARNTGTRTARGRIVCFTDDDCRPDPGWAAQLLRALERGNDAAGGRVIAGRSDDRYTRATQVIIEHLQRTGPSRQLVTFAPSNNLAVSRSLMLRLPFDETFPLASGEDRDWCGRLLAGGGSIAFARDAVVRHFPPTGARAFWRQHVRYGRGARRLANRRWPRSGVQAPSFYLGLVRAGFSRGIWCGALVAAAQVAAAIGFAAETHTLRRARRNLG